MRLRAEYARETKPLLCGKGMEIIMQKLSEQARGVLNDKKRIGIRDGWFGRMQGLFDGKGILF